MTLTIKITSDFICPWCLVGERRLEKAIAALPDGTNIELQWQPFELNPDMRPEGMDRKIYRSLKFGSWERSQMLDAHTVEAARGDGIVFNYAAMAKTPNTLAAHRLMRLAAERNKATTAARAIFSAYFEQGRDVGDTAVLADIAAETGLDREEALAYLNAGDGGVQVQEAERAAVVGGVRSVPHFDIAGTVISGAQPVEVFEAALRRGLAMKVGGADCSTGACSID